jgi:hypothetical protein
MLYKLRLEMSTATASSKVVLAPTPSRFNGDKQKYKSWKNSVQEYFAAYKADFGKIDPISPNMANAALRERAEAITRRINFILLLMKSENDTACTSYTWAENYKSQHWDEEECSLAWTAEKPVPTLKEFWALLDASFADASEKKLAQVKLERFYQGKQDFQTYIQQFEILVSTAGYVAGNEAHDAYLISLLEKQVHHEMMDRMYGTDVAPPTTYTDYKSRLTNISINIERRKALNQGVYYDRMAPVQQQQGSSSTTRTGSGDSPRSSSGVTPGYGAPMDIDRKRSRGPVCYNCQKPGHIAANCRSPKKQTRVRALLNDLKDGKEIKVDELKKAMQEEGF